MDNRVIPFALLLGVLTACGGAQTAEPTRAPLAPIAAPAATTAAVATTAPVAVATSVPASTAAAPTAAALTTSGPVAIRLEAVADGFDRPVFVTHSQADDTLYVVEKPGRINALRDGERAVVLDIADRVKSSGNEQGLLGLAFHPAFPTDDRLFVNYSNVDGDTIIASFRVTASVADPASETILLEIDQPYANHNGGMIAFGPDGMLYIGMGDGGAAGDPQGHAQNLDSLLGKVLRIDVNSGDPYDIPADNPWAQGGARPEIYAIGVRNPWRFSFDRTTGDLVMGDVGQNRLEEVNITPLAEVAGANYGWNITEGDSCFRGDCDLMAFVEPVATYGRSEGCSVTGGYVYRGAQFPQLVGQYIYGDFCSGRVWSVQPGASGWQISIVAETGEQISSFGEDRAGELYLVSYNGSIWRVVV